MKVLLTGITGNLGFEIAHSLNKREVEVVPIVRDILSLNTLCISAENAIVADLTENRSPINLDGVDCIVHSAGNVHFVKAGDSNAKMMRSVIQMAQDLDVPIYYVSTAFLWRSSGDKEELRNVYEKDKYHSEELLRNSGIRYSIFRPAVLVGNSKTGKLINWTGYYILVSKFLEAAKTKSDSKISFPVLTGTSNMIPVDQVAEIISEAVINNELNELVYVTNPEPPRAQWVLDMTLEFFGVRDRFEFLDTEFVDYEKKQRTDSEEVLRIVGRHFSPYWSLSYNFPKSDCDQNLITKEYLEKTLKLFQDFNNKKVV